MENEVHYAFFFAVLLAFGEVLYLSLANPLLSLSLDLFFCGILLLMLSVAERFLPPAEPSLRREVSLRRVLAGERLLSPQKKEKKLIFRSWFAFLYQMPPFTKVLLEYLNVGLLIGILIADLVPVFQNIRVQQWRYRLGIGLFLWNAFLLKKSQIFSFVSRFAVALIINFSLYISLIGLGEGIQTMLPWLIAWNVLCGVLIFYARFPALKAYLKKIDLMFWLLTTGVAMLLNIVLLMRLSLSGQLIFSLIFFYLGVQGMIAYYALQLIKSYDLAPQENSADSKDPLNVLLEKEIQL